MCVCVYMCVCVCVCACMIISCAYVCACACSFGRGNFLVIPLQKHVWQNKIRANLYSLQHYMEFNKILLL